MEINIWIVLGIIIVHWFADFVLQTDKQAKGKSKNWSDLLAHTVNYSSVWLPTMYILFSISSPEKTAEWYVMNSIYFACITFLLHTITDYFTSRLNSKLWSEGKVHNFFVSVGFDQVLHYVQLLLTFYYLK